MYRSFDYDLVILGASAGGLEAALIALQERSRVALLTLDLPLLPETIAQLDGLNQAGLDLIAGGGYFLPKDRGFQATERSNPLRSRAYLLALPGVPVVPNLPGLASVPYQTTVPRSALGSTAEHWLILGEGLESLRDCYTLRAFGQRVTLLLQTPLRSGLAQRLQGDLEGRGVSIFSPVHPLSVDSQDSPTLPAQDSYESPSSQIRVIADQGQWRGDRLLISIGQQPAPVDLNLQALHPQITLPLQVKPSLQSIFAPRLYGCGIALGGLALDSIDRYEARIAVPNALYFNHRVRRYDRIPYTRLSDPLVTQLGWTLETASPYWERSSLRSVEISGFWDSPLEHSPALQSANVQVSDLQASYAPTSYLQVLLDRHGQILGAQGIGTCAAQALQVLALARRQRQSWTALLRSLPGGDVADLLYGVQSQLRHQCPKAPSWESFFNWRRTGYL
jgi:pyruvate/2-oxoglutarate dehydrogenase complex dihydrolipoamide dehydrogenase (E3) component